MKMQDTNFIPPHDLHTPVLFLIFNRPETTKLVFEEIKKAKPPRLYIAADGPRNDNKGEAEKVTQVREYVMNNIDWQCEVKTLFRDNNLGCKYAVSGAIDWFFENEEMGIILEDDCLPSQSFFWFCEELLERYREDDRVATISGNNFQFGNVRTNDSYYFSRYPHIWGWASWRDEWINYDINMKLWPYIIDDNCLENILEDKKSIKFWYDRFKKTYFDEIDTWDYQWIFSCWVQNKLAILPSVNLVSNIGFGNDATHTKIKNNSAELETENLNIPLSHPAYMIRNSRADNFTENHKFSSHPLSERGWMKLQQIYYKILR